MERSQVADRCYRNDADQDMHRLLGAVMSKQNLALRAPFVKYAKSNNVVRRIVEQKANVYSHTVSRKLDDDRDQKLLTEFSDLLQLDAVMLELDRLLALHHSVFVQYRVRVEMGGVRQPCIDLVTPGTFIAINHPADKTLLVGVALDMEEYWFLDFGDEYMTLPKGTIVPRNLTKRAGPINWFIAHQTPPTTRGSILESAPGADVVAAHMSVWQQNISMLKESKSSTKVPTFAGDTTRIPTNQPVDSELPYILGEGATVTVMDLSSDTEQYQGLSDHIAERSAASQGVPPSVMAGADASSGSHLHVMRLPLIELRKRRIPLMLRVERMLWKIIERVNAVDLVQYVFPTDGMHINYSEVEEPLSPAERNAVFEKERQLGLTNTIREIRRRNPQIITDKDAVEFLAENVEVETVRVIMMMLLQKMNAHMGTSTGEQLPEGNGADGLQASNGDNRLPQRSSDPNRPDSTNRA